MLIPIPMIARQSQLENQFDGPIPSHRAPPRTYAPARLKADNLVRQICERRAVLTASQAADDEVLNRLSNHLRKSVLALSGPASQPE